jgi:hypothetical protein
MSHGSRTILAIFLACLPCLAAASHPQHATSCSHATRHAAPLRACATHTTPQTRSHAPHASVAALTGRQANRRNPPRSG